MNFILDILDRFKEPSSWAVITTALASFGLTIPDPVSQSVVLVGAGAAGLIAFFLREKGGQ